MALTKVTGSVIKDSVSLSGNVSIGGTLTYEDVTNVDSIGIGTFRNGIDVSGGQLDVGSNIKLGNAGVITATSFVGSGANLTGITQTTINSNTNNYLITGTGTANTLQGESTLTYNGNGTLEISDSGSSYTLKGASAKHEIGASASDNDLVIQNNKNAVNAASNIIFKGSGNGGESVKERLRIDSNGRLIKGHTSNIGQIRTQYQAFTQLYGSSNSTGLKIGTFSNDPYAGNLEFVKSRTATIVTSTLVQNNDTLGNIYWGAADGSQYQPAAYISAAIEGAPNTNDIPTRLSFGTTKDGAAGAGEKMRINPAGQIMIGDSTVGSSTNEKLIIQGMVTNDNYEASIALRRGSSINTGNAGLGYINFQDSAGSTGAFIGGRADSGWSGSSRPTHLWFATVKSGSTSLTEACRITSGGYLQQHNLPVASYSDTRAISLQNTDLTGSNFYNYLWYISDSSIFDSSTGHFIAPVHGVYRLYFRCTTDNVSGNRANVRLRKNGNTRNEAYASKIAGSPQDIQSVSSEIVDVLNAGEYMDIQVAQLHTQAGNQHKQVTFHMLG